MELIKINPERGNLYERSALFSLSIEVIIPFVVPQERHCVIVALSSLLSNSDDSTYSVSIKLQSFDFTHYFTCYFQCDRWWFLGQEKNIPHTFKHIISKLFENYLIIKLNAVIL